jgi:hypothetical protein
MLAITSIRPPHCRQRSISDREHALEPAHPAHGHVLGQRALGGVCAARAPPRRRDRRTQRGMRGKHAVVAAVGEGDSDILLLKGMSGFGDR